MPPSAVINSCSFMLERHVAPPAKILVLLSLPVTRKALSRQLALPSPPLLSVQAATWFGSFLSTYGGMVGFGSSGTGSTQASVGVVDQVGLPAGKLESGTVPVGA